MHPQKQGSCSRTSGMSFATWYAACVFASLNMVGDSTSEASDATVVSFAGSFVPRRDTHAIPAMIATAMMPSSTFCLLVDNDSPLWFIRHGRDNCFKYEEDFALFFVVQLCAVFHRLVQLRYYVLKQVRLGVLLKALRDRLLQVVPFGLTNVRHPGFCLPVRRFNIFRLHSSHGCGRRTFYGLEDHV